jgi:hypothetical protein
VNVADSVSILLLFGHMICTVPAEQWGVELEGASVAFSLTAAAATL